MFSTYLKRAWIARDPICSATSTATKAPRLGLTRGRGYTGNSWRRTTKKTTCESNRLRKTHYQKETRMRTKTKTRKTHTWWMPMRIPYPSRVTFTLRYGHRRLLSSRCTVVIDVTTRLCQLPPPLAPQWCSHQTMRFSAPGEPRWCLISTTWSCNDVRRGVKIPSVIIIDLHNTCCNRSASVRRTRATILSSNQHLRQCRSEWSIGMNSSLAGQNTPRWFLDPFSFLGLEGGIPSRWWDYCTIRFLDFHITTPLPPPPPRIPTQGHVLWWESTTHFILQLIEDLHDATQIPSVTVIFIPYQ